MTPRESEILSMQIRLFRQFMERHQVDKDKASQIFKEYDLFGFISECYGALHLSSDNCALNDIDTLLKNSGVSIETLSGGAQA